MRRKFCVGLTGGIGSGKTTVSGIFRDLGAEVIDADSISRDLTKPGKAAYSAVIELIGRDAVDGDGNLRRDYLRERVFDDEALRLRLESLIHPLVRDEINTLVNRPGAGYCILCIPLLIEKNSDYNIDRILVVDVPEALQEARASARDGVTTDQIRKIIRTQVPRDVRLGMADDVIINDGDIETLAGKVRVLHEKYLAMSAAD